MGTCLTGFSEDRKREISALYVDESAQGHGIGSELLGMGFDWHISHDGQNDPVYIGVFKGTQALQFYRKRGFRGIGMSSLPYKLKSGTEIDVIDMRIEPDKRDDFITSLASRRQ